MPNVRVTLPGAPLVRQHQEPPNGSDGSCDSSSPVDRPEPPDTRLNSSTPRHDGPVWCPSRLRRIDGESWLQHVESARAWIEERRGRVPRPGTDDANGDPPIFYFRNAADNPTHGEFYIGSADWMYRNLLARVEAVVPIQRKPHRERLWDIFTVMLNDQRQAWDMKPDGSYVQRRPTDPTTQLGTHQTLMALARQAATSGTPAAADARAAR